MRARTAKGSVKGVLRSPHRGVQAILENRDIEVAGAMVNVVPGQGSETVRTDETALTVLALIESQNRTE